MNSGRRGWLHVVIFPIPCILFAEVYSMGKMDPQGIGMHIMSGSGCTAELIVPRNGNGNRFVQLKGWGNDKSVLVEHVINNILSRIDHQFITDVQYKFAVRIGFG